MQAGRKAAKAAKAAPEAPPQLGEGPVEIAGTTYYCLSDGRCYQSGQDGVLGAWAGMLRNGVLDTTVSEF
jgi:hypothetical protein